MGPVVKLRVLLALILLFLLFVRSCPGGAFDKRELCLFGTGINGTAPGTVSSVSPTLEFGALAMKSGCGIIAAGGCWIGEVFHVQGLEGDCLRAMESMLSPRGVWGVVAPRVGLCFCSLHDSISSSLIGVTPRWSRNGDLPLLYLYVRHIAREMSIRPTDPRTVVRIIIRFLCAIGMSSDFGSDESGLAFEEYCKSLALLWVTRRSVGVEDEGLAEADAVSVELEEVERGSDCDDAGPSFEFGGCFLVCSGSCVALTTFNPASGSLSSSI